MARLGVVVGVAEYTGSPSNLPACKTDAAAFLTILEQTGRFDDILALSGSKETVSSNVKNRLSEFADKHRASTVEEVVFYFSGHGDFDGDDFSYILSDFDSKRKNATSLSNSELDGIFRSLNPELFVKIVDACHSGVSYIKNEGRLEEYLKSINDRFHNIYFMFSSQSDESSYATVRISDFTKSLLSTVAGTSPGPVRYRDLMSAISDEFETAGGQTPLFVVQATNTEVFCEASPELSKLLEERLAPTNPHQGGSGKSLSLKDRILAAENNFCTREDAVQALDELKNEAQGWPIATDLNGLYAIAIEENTTTPAACVSIGRWIEENVSEEVFARAVKETETYLAPERETLSSRVLALTRWERTIGTPRGKPDPEIKMVQKSRQVVKGFGVTTTGLPYIYLLMKLNPQVKAVEPAECDFIPIFSRTKMTLFYRYRRFSYVDWDKTSPKSTASWARLTMPIRSKDERKFALEKILSGFFDFVRTHLTEKFPDLDSAEHGRAPQEGSKGEQPSAEQPKKRGSNQ